MNTSFDRQWEKAKETHNGNAMCNLIYFKSLMRGIDNLKAECDLLNLSALSCKTKLGSDHYRQRIAALGIEAKLTEIQRGLESVLGCMIDDNLERFANEQAKKGGAQ